MGTGKDDKSAGMVKFDLGFDLGNLKEQLATALSFASKNASGTMKQTQSAYQSAANAMGKTSKALVKESTDAANIINQRIKSKTDEFVKRGISESEALDKAMKSVAASMAAVYKKQGMSQSDAFKKAWSEIERTSAVKSAKVKKHIKGVGTQSKSTAGLMSTSFGSAFQKIASMAAAAFSVRAVLNFTKSCLDLGSDLTEVQNVVDTTFGSMAESVNVFAQSAMETYGMSETVAKKYMGTFGAMSKAMGMSIQQSYEMSEAVTGLTGDVASFFNLSTDEAYTKLKSIWTGETETLKDLGVVMTQTALDQYAMNNGFGKTIKNMTEQEKLMLRYRYVMSNLSDASGDFAKTSKTWANQTRILSLRFDALKASIGQGLINIFTPILVMINNLLAGIQKLADGFAKLTSIFTGKQAASGGISGIAGAAGIASENISNMGSAAAGAAKEAKRVLAGFDKLNVISSDSSSGGGGGGGGSATLPDISTGIGEENKELTTFEKFAERIREGFSGSFQKIRDSAISMGNTIRTNLSGGFRQFVEEDGDRAIQKADEIFSHTVGIADSIGNFSEAFANVFQIFESPEAQNITGNLFSIFSDNFLNITLLASKFGDDIIDMLTSPFVENADVIKEGLAEMLGPLSEISDKVKQFVQDTWDTVQNAYDKYISPAFEKVKELWTKYLGSDDFKSHMSSMKDSLDRINTALQPIFDVASKLFSFITGSQMASMGNGIQVFGQIGLFVFQGIVSAIDKALENFSNMVQFISSLCSGDWKNAMGRMGEAASQAVTNIKNVFSNIPNWFKNTFSDAWSKVQQVFSKGGQVFVGIQDGITSTFRKIVNNLVSGLNTIIRIPFRNINNMLNKIRSINILGNAPFSNLWPQNPIAVPSIPYLAKGGIINQPTLAMVGESGKEAVMPLENNTDWIDKLADKISSKVGSGSREKITVNVVLEGDAAGIFRVVKVEADNYTKTTGNPAFAI